MERTILHVDINSYFATMLQQENPHLRGKPIGVVKDEGRTCLIALSKEAKQFGIETGARKQEALTLCPQLLCLPASFERYLDATKRLQKVFLTVAPSVYIYSLDEAFIDVTDCREHLYPDLEKLGKTIQDRIKTELGEWVTCNIGIANNRFMAKMASEVAPKGGVSIVTPDKKELILATTPFKDVCGIGYRLSKKLARCNVFYPYQIRFIPEEELHTLFGPFWSVQLAKMAYGEEPHLLQQIDREIPHMKSVGRSITGYHLYQNPTEIKRILHNLSIEIIEKVRIQKLAGRNIWIGLYGQEGYWSAHLTIATPINQVFELINRVDHLYKQWNHSFEVIKFAVRLSLLEPHQQDQLLPSWQKHESIQRALDTINTKFGRFTARPAAVPPQKELIYPEVTGFLGDKLYQLRNE
ncbi:MAG: hypothetical protein H6773_01620 [Pseudomonadales bacterium]|nr:hypothetical protein [Candidatus Woesebacteria bacterium]MCB9800855.1 hypothetical protein [Pseudomonadales bacterium]